MTASAAPTTPCSRKSAGRSNRCSAPKSSTVAVPDTASAAVKSDRGPGCRPTLSCGVVFHPFPARTTSVSWSGTHSRIAAQSAPRASRATAQASWRRPRSSLLVSVVSQRQVSFCSRWVARPCLLTTAQDLTTATTAIASRTPAPIESCAAVHGTAGRYIARADEQAMCPLFTAETKA